MSRRTFPLSQQPASVATGTGVDPVTAEYVCYTAVYTPVRGGHPPPATLPIPAGSSAELALRCRTAGALGADDGAAERPPQSKLRVDFKIDDLLSGKEDVPIPPRP